MSGDFKLGFVLAILVAALAACGQPSNTGEHGHEGAEASEFERGPHRGRMLRSGDFAVEITIFETGVPPEFHVYTYKGDAALKPADVKLAVVLKRLGGKTNKFAFAPVGEYLRGNGVVVEPHSFDVEVTAVHAGETHKWSYASYEGRATIADKAAADAGVTTEAAGPATVKLTVSLLGAVELAPGAKAELRARFPGRVVSVAKNLGDAVNAGETLARVESNESLQTYSITAPVAGIVLSRDVNPGDVTDDHVLFVVGDTSKLAAQFHVFDGDAGRVKAGQAVRVVSLDGKTVIETTIASISPMKDPATQTVIARARVDSSAFLPGASVKGDVVVDEAKVDLAVKTEAIQPFRDFEVVYAKVGETYEVRMLEIGRRSPEWTEILGGVEPGEVYVVANSYLIKADIEKSGASHDH